MQDLSQTLDDLKKYGRCVEAYEVTHYKVWRPNRNGDAQEVNIEILDAGPTHTHRYHITATDVLTGKQASGNGGETIEIALATMHWGNID